MFCHTEHLGEERYSHGNVWVEIEHGVPEHERRIGREKVALHALGGQGDVAEVIELAVDQQCGHRQPVVRLGSQRAVSSEVRMRTVSRFGRCALASRAYRWTCGSRAIIWAAYWAKWFPGSIACAPRARPP